MMDNMEYTPYKEKWINNKIHSDMQVICKEILKVVDPISIILLGGFGRGEGSVIVKKGSIQPLKDYDILLVLEKKIPLSELEGIVDNAQKILGYNTLIDHDAFFSDFEISILPITIDYLRHLGDIKAYEIKKASKIVYGKDVRNEIKISRDDIPLSSGSRFLFNKAVGLLKRFSAEYLQTPPGKRERNCLIYECAKVYMDIGTALCLISGNFRPTYSERSEIIKENFENQFPELAEKAPHLIERIVFFTNLKLFPDENKWNEIEAVKLWFDTREDFGITLRYYMNRYLKV